MLISIITPTCREAPRLDLAGRTLAASCVRAAPHHPDVQFEWIIVDEKARGLNDLGVLGEQSALVEQAITSRLLSVKVIAPLPSPHRTAADRRPAHNSARNAGLAESAGADYVVFLNDCQVVTADWATVACEIAKKGLGWKVKAHTIYEMPIPNDGVVRYRDHNDLIRPIPVPSWAGSCWGAPRAALLKIAGFDLAYDGEAKGEDQECTIRLGRIGVIPHSTERAYVVYLRRTKIDAEISTNKDAHAGRTNRDRLDRLTADRARIFPEVVAPPFKDLAPDVPPVAAPSVDVATAAEQAAEPALPSWKRRPKRPVEPARVSRTPRTPRVPKDRTVAAPPDAGDARPADDAAPITIGLPDGRVVQLADTVIEAPSAREPRSRGSEKGKTAPARQDAMRARAAKRPVIVFDDAPPADATEEPAVDTGANGAGEHVDPEALEDLADEFDVGGGF